jgi:hypothetical protein
VAIEAVRKLHVDPQVTAEALASAAMLWWDAESDGGIEALKAYLEEADDQGRMAELFAALVAAGQSGNA